MSRVSRGLLTSMIVLCVLVALTLGATIAYATTSMGYYDQEDEPNDSMATADLITSERLMRGSFPSISDNYDYYQISIAGGNSIYVQLSSIPTGCDYDLELYDSGGTSLAASVNSSDVGEWISYNITSTGTYYIRVLRYSGSSASLYRLYAQTSGTLFNHSYYITNVGSDDYMYWLGQDHTNNLVGLVFLSFGEAEKRGSEYGINDLGGHWANVLNNGWTAEDIWYISYGNACSYCVPEIYVSGHVDQWTYQKKWAILHSKSQADEGVMSTNGWDGLYQNQQSYSVFYNKLQSEGVGESLENRTWIALASQP